MRISRLFKRLRRWSSHAFRNGHSPTAFRTCRNAGNSVLTAEGLTSKGTGSIRCEVGFCIFYRLSLRTLWTKDVVMPACAVLLFYPNHFIDVYRCSCNSRAHVAGHGNSSKKSVHDHARCDRRAAWSAGLGTQGE
jgi:hypothetical protein